MTTVETDEMARLRSLAETCRRLAACARHSAPRQYLTGLAAECDSKAEAHIAQAR